MSKNTATKIFEWKALGDTFRLIAIGKYNKGYEDQYVLEKSYVDSLGDPCWVKCDEEPDPVLVAGIKAALAASTCVCTYNTATSCICRNNPQLVTQCPQHASPY